MTQHTKRKYQGIPEDFGDCNPHQQRAWFERRNRRIDGTVARENHELDRKLDAELEEIGAQIIAEWTLETTTTRRAEWNAAIKAGEATGRNGKVDGRKLQALQRRLGWTINDLKGAVKRHGL